MQKMRLPEVDVRLSIEKQARIYSKLLSEWVEDFGNGMVVDGVETMQGHVVKEIGRVGMSEVRDIDVARVITHIDN